MIRFTSVWIATWGVVAAAGVTTTACEHLTADTLCTPPFAPFDDGAQYNSCVHHVRERLTSPLRPDEPAWGPATDAGTD